MEYGRLLDLPKLQKYLSVGRNNALKIGKDSGALIKLGRKNLYDKERLDAYISRL